MKIAIIGANGQVGREVTLFLYAMGVEVIPISRTELGGIFLERCGLDCRYGSIGNSEDAKFLLEGCDLVVDFAHPHTLPVKLRNAVRQNIDNAIQYSPLGTPYVYISTISAFGMPNDHAKMKDYVLSHTMYSADKRHLERYALAKQGKKDIFVLRLGQVHGELQMVSREFQQECADGLIYLPFPEETESYSIFCYSIAEVLINITNKKEAPGRYTMVSTPAWSWGELYKYWAKKGEKDIEFAVNVTKANKSSIYECLIKLGRFLLFPVIRLAIKHRQLIMNYFVPSSERAQQLMQSELLRRRAEEEISLGDSLLVGRTFQIGRIPGKRLTSLSDSRESMIKMTATVCRIIKDADPSL
jgi:nucleoside-diphosphate-sugar epimerase